MRTKEVAKPAEVPHSEDAPQPMLAERIEATVKRDKDNLKQPSPQNQDDSRSQPLIRLPDRHNPLSSEPTQSDSPLVLSSSTHLDPLPPIKEASATLSSSLPTSPQPLDQPTVIFATGGITNGKQLLEVLNAGASVAMVYTALGGVGTISRINKKVLILIIVGRYSKIMRHV